MQDRTGSTRLSLGTEPVSGAARLWGAGRGQTLPSKAFRCFLSQGLQRASASGVCRINLMTCEKDFEEDLPPRHVGPSQTRAQSRVPCVGRQILNHLVHQGSPESGIFLS